MNLFYCMRELPVFKKNLLNIHSFIFLLFALPFYSKGQVDTISFNKSPLFINKGLILQDYQGKYSYEEIMERKDLEKDSLSSIMPDSARVHWLHYYVKNDLTKEQTWVIEFDFFWSDIQLFLLDSLLVSRAKTGFSVPNAEKDLVYRVSNYLPITLKAGQEGHLLIRMERNSLARKYVSSANFEINTWEKIQEKEQLILNIFFFFMGIFSIMFFYSLFIGWVTRERNYFFILTLVIAAILTLLLNIGTILPFLHSNYLALKITIIYNPLFPIILLLFIRNFFSLPQNFPFWNKAILAWIFIGLMIPVLSIFFDDDAFFWGLGQDFHVYSHIPILIVLIKAVLKKLPSAGYFLAAELMYPILFILPAAGVYSYFNYSCYVTIIIILFSFALARRINLLRGENEQKQALVIEAERKNRRLIEERADKLQALDKIKDQFLANTSHELRTPLNGIIGISESLMDLSEKLSPQKLRENLSMVVSSGKRLASLVNDLLDFSKLKNKDLNLRQKPLDLYSVSDYVIKMIQPLVGDKQIELINEVPKNLTPVFADENRTIQVLNNLVGNAIKFTEFGYVKITAQQKEEMVEISTEDTGIGIPSEKLEMIFEDFEQADSTSNRVHAGTGLGLSISKKLVELHGGKMWVISKVGLGSTFYFSMPISKEKPSISPIKTTSLTPLIDTTAISEPPLSISKTHLDEVAAMDIDFGLKPNSGFLRILIVDDEPINHQVLKNHLALRNFQIITAMNGLEALQLLEQEGPFDLVLLDVMMPQMSGFEVCQRIREKYLPSELPIIMVTAKNQVQNLVEGLSFGANDYLAKPFSKQEFLARIKTHLYLHKINTATGKFVPHEFIRSLGKESITEIRLGDHVQREVTVLFADIRDYTSLSEKMEPEENFRFVTAYSKRMGLIIDRNNGFINQYYGDGIMALFLDKPTDAVEAAIEMQKKIRDYNKRRILKTRKPIRVGVGMHTGPLIMGIIGFEKRNEATTISDAVNTASRMEGLTKIFRSSIIVSEDTLMKIENAAVFNYRYLGKVLVKGKQEPKGIYDFFDGDAPLTFQLKLKTKNQFDEMLRLYFDKDFERAIIVLQQILSIYPADSVAQYYLSKCEKYLVDGVSKDWTGIEYMVEK